MPNPIPPMDIQAFLDRLAFTNPPKDHAPSALSSSVVVVLDRADQASWDYAVHGLSECVDCGHPVLLGKATLDPVLHGWALPLCLPCSRSVSRSAAWSAFTFLGRLEDQ